MDITSRDIVSILKLIQELGYRRFRLQHGDLVLEVDAEGGRAMDGSSVAPTAFASGPAAAEATARPIASAERPPTAGAVAIRAPMTGTFYRAPSPGAAPFVEVNSEVDSGQVVCIVEVMKLFSSISAGVTGRIVEICVQNEAAVSAGQVLIWVAPKTDTA